MGPDLTLFLSALKESCYAEIKSKEKDSATDVEALKVQAFQYGEFLFWMSEVLVWKQFLIGLQESFP